MRDRASHSERYTSQNSRFASAEKNNLRSGASDAKGGYGPTGYHTRESSIAPRNWYADEDDTRYDSTRDTSHYAQVDYNVPIEQNARDMFELDPTDPRGYRDLLVHECVTKLAQITHAFRQLSYRCADLKIDVRPVPHLPSHSLLCTCADAEPQEP